MDISCYVDNHSVQTPCDKTTCMYSTTIGSGCICTQCGNVSAMSIEEIAYFKKIDVEKATRLLAKTEERVKHLLVLEKWLHWTETQIECPKRLFKIVDKWYQNWPMNTGLWPIGRRLLKHISDEDKWASFCIKFKVDKKAHEIIGMDLEDFEYVKKIMAKY